MVCQGLPANGFLSGMLGFIDCQAQAIGAGGYQALAAPGSTLSLVLAGLLTLFVAFFGYRMLLGETLSVRDGVLAMVKIGLVLALATGWTAYRTLIYDVALKGPAELAGEIGAPSGLPGSSGGLVARLDNADRLFLAYAELGPGAAVVTAGEGTSAAATGFTDLFLGGARVLFLAGAISALAVVRLIAGVLLALGPFFIAFLLFDGTRGLFEGWLRVLGGAALGALGAGIALGVELALIEPWLVSLIATRTAGFATPGAPIELFVVALVFAVALGAMLFAAARVAYGFRLPAAWRSVPAQLVDSRRAESWRVPALAGEAVPAAIDRSRAVTVADAVAATQRRETQAPAVVTSSEPGAPARHAIPPGTGRDEPPPPPVPLGQSFARRTRSRHSASASRRDGKP